MFVFYKMDEGVLHWLYAALSQVSLGNGYRALGGINRAVIMNCSNDMQFLLLRDDRYSVFAIVSTYIQSVLRLHSKNSSKDLIGTILPIKSYHFACVKDKIIESKILIHQ